MKLFPLLVLATSAVAIKPVTQELYDRIVYYAQLSAAATLGAPCKTPPYNIPIQTYIDVPDVGVEATIFRNDTSFQFILGFAATNNSINYVEDLNATLTPALYNFQKNCPNCKLHAGFQIAYGDKTNASSTAKQVRDAVVAAFAANPRYRTYNLTITGASLGGALASLSYADLVQDFRSKITAVYTYGEPRVGNPAYANYIDSNSGSTINVPGLYYRVTHANDIIVKAPPGGGTGPNDYRHSLTEYWESRLDGDSNTPASTYQCVGQEDTSCNFGTPLETASGAYAHEHYAGFASVKCN